MAINNTNPSNFNIYPKEVHIPAYATSNVAIRYTPTEINKE